MLNKPKRWSRAKFSQRGVTDGFTGGFGHKGVETEVPYSVTVERLYRFVVKLMADRENLGVAFLETKDIAIFTFLNQTVFGFPGVEWIVEVVAIYHPS